MKIESLKIGVQRVRHVSSYAPPLEMNLSVVEAFGIKGVRAFFDGEKPPRRGKHLLLTDSIRNWISELEPA